MGAGFPECHKTSFVGVVEVEVEAAPYVRLRELTRQVESGVKIIGCAERNGAARNGAIFPIINVNGEAGVGQEAARVVGYKGAAGSNATMDAGGE
jgi:hypothetical protein